MACPECNRLMMEARSMYSEARSIQEESAARVLQGWDHATCHQWSSAAFERWRIVTKQWERHRAEVHQAKIPSTQL